MNVNAQILSTISRAWATDLDLTKPPMLLYVERDGSWQLVGVEYALPGRPAKNPFPGAEWHEHEASCHYRDYRELPGSRTAQCPPRHPESGSEFALWHSAVAVAHVWAWYPNPKGPFAEDNPYLVPYGGAVALLAIAMHEVVRKSRTQSSITVLRACSFADRCGDFLGVPPPTRVPLEHNVRSTWIIFGVYLFVRSDPEA